MTIKDAIHAAEENVKDLFPSAVPSSVRLEGAELSDDDQYWLVTYSFFEMADSAAESHDAFRRMAMDIRAYKTFKIKADDGKFVGFRNGFANAA